MFPHSIQPIKLLPIDQDTHFSTKMCRIVKKCANFVYMTPECVCVCVETCF